MHQDCPPFFVGNPAPRLWQSRRRSPEAISAKSNFSAPVLLLITGVSLFIWMTACGQQAQAAQKITIAALNAPPYVTRDETGDVSGILVDFLQKTLPDAGLEPEFVVEVWARAYADVKLGQIDALIPTIETPEREKDLLFVKRPLATLDMVLIGRSDRTFKYDGTISSLSGYYIGHVNGAHVEQRFDKAAADGLFDLEGRSGFGLLALSVANDRLDLFAGDRLMGVWGARTKGVWNRLQILSPPLGQVPVHLALSRKSPVVDRLGEISSAMSRGKVSGIYERIVRNYVPEMN